MATSCESQMHHPHYVFPQLSNLSTFQEVDKSQYDMTRYGRLSPLVPFFQTSCMDCAEPYLGDGPCCSVHRRSAFTPTVAEGALQSQAKQEATQVSLVAPPL